MNPDQQIISTSKQKYKVAIEHFEDELKKIRTGRAHPSMLDSIKVVAYGAPMPLIQVATIATPEPQLLQITPFDPNNLQAISASIREDQTLGLNPVDDGRVIRVQIPPLTTERRQQIVKQLGSKTEEAMIRLRNIRHEAREEAEKAKKDKQMSEDDFKRFSNQLDELVQQQKTQIEKISKAKETEIMTV
jgi:ribosome recycling factor